MFCMGESLLLTGYRCNRFDLKLEFLDLLSIIFSFSGTRWWKKDTVWTNLAGSSSGMTVCSAEELFLTKI
jgi:hypothetical protein